MSIVTILSAYMSIHAHTQALAHTSMLTISNLICTQRVKFKAITEIRRSSARNTFIAEIVYLVICI